MKKPKENLTLLREQARNSVRYSFVAPQLWGERLDAWRTKQKVYHSRGDAIRVLVERALDAEQQKKDD